MSEREIERKRAEKWWNYKTVASDGEDIAKETWKNTKQTKRINSGKMMVNHKMMVVCKNCITEVQWLDNFVFPRKEGTSFPA